MPQPFRWLVSTPQPLTFAERERIQFEFFNPDNHFYLGVIGICAPIAFAAYHQPHDRAIQVLFGLGLLQLLVRIFLRRHMRDDTQRRRLLIMLIVLAAAFQIGLNVVACVLGGDFRTICVAIVVEEAMIGAIVTRNSGLPRLAMTQLVITKTLVLAALVYFGAGWTLLLAGLAIFYMTALFSTIRSTHRLVAQVVSAQSESARAASSDPLTQLLNRRGLMAELEAALNDADARDCTAIWLDLDRFKLVNDRLGHAAGDTVLREVARRLTDVLPETWRIARFGGDEFVILARGCDLATAAGIRHRIVDAIGAPYTHVGDGTVDIGASVGMASIRAGMTTHEILSIADRALYRDKKRLSS